MDEEAGKAVWEHKGGPIDDYEEARSFHSTPFRPSTEYEYEGEKDEEEKSTVRKNLISKWSTVRHNCKDLYRAFPVSNPSQGRLGTLPSSESARFPQVYRYCRGLPGSGRMEDTQSTEDFSW